ncbi:MAG: SPFH domain-containing protein [Phycisphaeraceae bacterium]
MAHDQQTYGRGTWASLLGLGIQLAMAIGLLLASFWIEDTRWPVGTIALYAMAWYAFAAVPIWSILAIIFNEHRRERIEALEQEELSRRDKASAQLFQEQGDDLAISKRRLATLYKWGVRVVAWNIATFLIAIGSILVSKALFFVRGDAGAMPMPAAVNTAVLMALFAGVGFVAFTVSRYHAGMTKVREWQPLRGGAGHLMGVGLMAGLLLVASLFAHFESIGLFKLMAVIVPFMLILLGAEIIFSMLLAMYSPRKPGEIPRLPFDSRLLGWLISPESIGKIVSETLTYQFGISRSWFYQLLKRAMIWLIIFGAGILILVSCIVVVPPEGQAIITTFGSINGEGEDAVKGPGLYLKLPWPISEAHILPTGRVREFSVGSVRETIKLEQPILWTSEHGKEEFLIAAPSALVTRAVGAPVEDNPDTPGMNLVGAEIVVSYRIVDLLKYVQAAVEPHQLLTTLADRQVTVYFASHDIDTLIARGSIEGGGVLQKLIQQDADRLGLGVKIINVVLPTIHPPQAEQVAERFLDQVNALQESESRIEKAQQEATEIYASVAGSRTNALAIRSLIAEFNVISTNVDELRRAAPLDQAAVDAAIAQRDAKELEIADLITKSPGMAAQMIYASRAVRWELVNSERAKAAAFASELKAYQNAKNYYSAKLYLEVLANTLVLPRKYIIAAEQTLPLMIEMDLKSQGSAVEGLIRGIGQTP